jgi:nitrite reductase (NO-forming)
VIVDLEAREEVQEIAPGVNYETWSFNGFVPGPIIRVQVGDTVEVRLRNNADSKVAHNIDLHSVNGPGGGAEATTVAPGETKSFTFKALAPGLFTYHCAAGIVADHIANGMYGGILVEKPRGRALYDREYYIGQSEYYVTEGDSPELDLDSLLSEDARYVVWNGSTEALLEEDALAAPVGETVRLYVANGGPNYTSSFHVIGEIFDRVYMWGSLADAPIRDISTVSVPPGGAVITDMKLDVPGDYKIVDHALGRLTKGIVGILTATGEQDFEIFRDLQEFPLDGEGDGDGEPSPTAEPTGASPQPTTTATEAPRVTEEIPVEMDDNVFLPGDLTVEAGSEVTFVLENIGVIPHNMRIADDAGSYDGGPISEPELINGGDSGELTWQVPDNAGTYAFRCDVHPVDMVGTITVQ